MCLYKLRKSLHRLDDVARAAKVSGRYAKAESQLLIVCFRLCILCISMACLSYDQITYSSIRKKIAELLPKARTKLPRCQKACLSARG